MMENATVEQPLRSDRPEVVFSHTKIANLSEDEKPREKAMSLGVRSLSDAELMALLLGSGQQGKSAIDLAREILAECSNSVSRLAQMPIMEMVRRFKGVGPAKAVTIAAALQLGQRAKRDESQPKTVRTSADAFNYMRPFMEFLDAEEFWIIVLSRSNQIRRAECVSRGGTAATYVDPKMVMKRAIDSMASSIILCHNHPSGNCSPSAQDDALTKRLKSAGEIIDIRVLDHIIVCNDTFYSYADEGRM